MRKSENVIKEDPTKSEVYRVSRDIEVNAISRETTSSFDRLGNKICERCNEGETAKSGWRALRLSSALLYSRGSVCLTRSSDTLADERCRRSRGEARDERVVERVARECAANILIGCESISPSLLLHAHTQTHTVDRGSVINLSKAAGAKCSATNLSAWYRHVATCCAPLTVTRVSFIPIRDTRGEQRNG